MRVFRQIFCLKNLIPFMGLLQDIQAEIETRSLSGGGWTAGQGSRAGVETTCYALMALDADQEPARQKAIDVLLRIQNSDGSWPAFEGDDSEACWTTALAAIALRFVSSPLEPLAKALRWLLRQKGREGHWLWKWKFRTLDRAVQFNPDKYGWPWFPGTVSWVIPTAFSLIALKQSLSFCGSERPMHRIRLGTEMLRDRACPEGGWNAGNGVVFGSALRPHVDATAIALLALTESGDGSAAYALNWLLDAANHCPSAYSLAWSLIAFCIHRDAATDRCMDQLRRVIAAANSVSNVEILSLAAIAIKAAEGIGNPFEVIV
jgi:Prenyltransferase and squalene oxidase repeat